MSTVPLPHHLTHIPENNDGDRDTSLCCDFDSDPSPTFPQEAHLRWNAGANKPISLVSCILYQEEV